MKLKKMVTAVLASSLIVSQFSVPAYAQKASEETKVPETIMKFVKENAQKKSKEREYVKGEAIVLFSKGYTKKAKKNAAAQTAFSKDITIKNMYNFSNSNGKVALNGASGISYGDCVVGVVKSDKLSTQRLIKELEKNGNIEKAEPNYKVHTTDIGDYSSYQWALNNTGQNAGDAGKDINVDAVWKKDCTGTDKVIAIIDSGLDYNNPEFKDRVWVNTKLARLPGVHGYDFANYDPDPMDDCGHGTHCAGIIAASTEKSQTGIQGLNQEAKIMPVKFIDSYGGGTTEGAISAYNYVYQAQCLGVDIVAVNNSWGLVESSIFNEIVKKVGEKGAVSCFAAGNDSIDNDKIEDIIGQEENPYMIMVAASNEKDELAQFSSYGKNLVSLAAPGTDILSTVSYDSFNPAIYDDALLYDLCGDNHNNYDSANIANYNKVTTADAYNKAGAYVASQEFGIPSLLICENEDGTVDENVTFDITADEKEYFGKTGKSLKLTAKGVKQGQLVSFVFPIDTPAGKRAPRIGGNIRTRVPHSTATTSIDGEEYELKSVLMLGVISEKEYKNAIDRSFVECQYGYGVDIDGETNYWKQMEEDGLDAKSNKEYCVIGFNAAADGEYTMWLDDFATTKGQKDEEQKYGHYAFYNGTSMATPYVTGSIALLSTMYPKASPEELIRIALGAVRKSDSLKNKCKSEGVLDLSLINDPAPTIDKIAVEGQAKIAIYGMGFKSDAIVKVNKSQVKATISKEGDKILIDGRNLLNHKITISVSTDRGEISRDVMLISGKEMTFEGTAEDFFGRNDIFGVSLVSDGKKYYGFFMSEDGGISVYTMDDKKKLEEKPASFDTVFDNFDSEKTFASSISDYVYSNGAIYVIASLDNFVSYGKDYKLAKYDIESGEFSAVADLPDCYDSVQAGQLAAYNGELYIIGGYDYNTKSLSRKVMKYNLTSKKWTQAPSLPEGRDGGKCIQTGDKLVYVMGSSKIVDKKSSCPKPLIFDGSKWTVSKAILNSDNYYSLGYSKEDEFHAYAAKVSLCKEGILISGIDAEGLGNVFVYNVAKDCYQRTEYKLPKDVKSVEDATVVNGKYIAFIYSKLVGYNLYSMPVNSGLVKVKADSTTKATLNVDAAGYLPGTTVTIKATAKKGYKINSLTIDGKTYKGTTARIVIKKDTVVKINASRLVTKIKLNKTKATLKVGKTFKLKATIIPTNATTKMVKWVCSNTKYATVSSSGVVKAKKAGKGKTITITCIATDGSNVKVKCKIKIK